MMADTKLCSRVVKRQPFAVFLCGAIIVNAVRAAH
jgi:hypothetical protein